jgi:hypothetical protein
MHIVVEPTGIRTIKPAVGFANRSPLLPRARLQPLLRRAHVARMATLLQELSGLSVKTLIDG